VKKPPPRRITDEISPHTRELIEIHKDKDFSSPNIEPELCLTMDEFVKAFRAKNNCTSCWGRGFQRLLKSMEKDSETIKGKVKMRDGRTRIMATQSIQFCHCVMKRYHKHLDAGGEKMHVIQNEAVSGQAPPNKGIMFFCSVHDKEVEIRDCHACFMADKYIFYDNRLECVTKNAVKIEKKGV